MDSGEFKTFWNKMTSPAHAHASESWYDRYAKEILFYLQGAHSIVDAGCGSGEILTRIAPHFEKVIAVDYSESMLDNARQRILESGNKHVEFYCDNITQVDRFCREPVDAIYCNGVIQYLNLPEVEAFISRCRKVLRPNGRIVLLNIPNINSRILFLLGFYRHEEEVSFYRVLKGLPRLLLNVIIFKFTNRFRPFDDGIGNWFSIRQMRDVGSNHGFDVQIYGASVVNYYYRYHAVFTIGSKA